MKLFQSTLKFYGLMGLYPSQSNQKNCTINFKNSVFLFCQIPSIISTFGFFLFKATSAIERTQTFYICLTHIGCTINFLTSFSKMSVLLDLIEKFEEFFQRSELLTILIGLNEIQTYFNVLK